MGPTKQPDDRVLELDAENARLRTLLRQAGIDAGHAADADLETTPNGNREDGGFLRAILESSTDYAIVATDLSGHVTSWNEGARRIMGWTESEMLGERVHRFFTPEDVKNGQPDREMDGVIENGRATDERWHVRSDGSRFWASGMLTPLVTDGNLHVGYVKVLRDLTAQKEAEERQQLLQAELQHRVKNTLAMVQAIASQTFREAGPEEREAFTARLIALGSAHDLLTQANWARASLRDVVSAALLPHASAEGRFEVAGPDFELASKPALGLSLALHELATNAAKYGALSGEEGHIAIAWEIAENNLRFRWTETGGPFVSPPNHKGFGSRLIERSLAADFRGRVRLDFRAEGLVCDIEAPLTAIQDTR